MAHRGILEELENRLFQQTDLQNLEIDRLKKNQAIELEEQKVTSEQSLCDIKYLYEQEKIKLEERLEKALNELRMLRLAQDNKKETDFFNERGMNELHELSSRISVLKRQRDEDILDAQRERDEGLRKIERLESALKKSKDSAKVEQTEHEKKAKGLEQKLAETRAKLFDQDKNQGEILKLRK